MSVYESYDETSRNYDATREPIGAEIVLGCLARHAGPLDRVRLLDAGCGTGAYSRALIGRIGRIDALDMSRGMLAVAREKLRAEAGRIAFHQGSITDLSFAEASFDAVMINQVVHHLGDHENAEFALLRRVIGEVARILRPGGCLVFNHCSRRQLRDAYWYRALVPRAGAELARRFAPLATLRALFAASGLEHRGSFVPLDAVCQGPAYFDGRGPLRKSWRDGDSLWALAGTEELAAAQDQVRALDAAGRLDAYVAEQDAGRGDIGQITFLCAQRV